MFLFYLKISSVDRFFLLMPKTFAQYCILMFAKTTSKVAVAHSHIMIKNK